MKNHHIETHNPNFLDILLTKLKRVSSGRLPWAYLSFTQRSWWSRTSGLLASRALKKSAVQFRRLLLQGLLKVPLYSKHCDVGADSVVRETTNYWYEHRRHLYDMGMDCVNMNKEKKCCGEVSMGSSSQETAKKGRTKSTLHELQARDAQILLEGVRGLRDGDKGINSGMPQDTGDPSTAPGGYEEIPRASMSFAGDDHLEHAFVIWTAQNCQGFSIRIHTMIAIVFLMGFVKSCIMLCNGQGLLTNVALLGAIQISVVVHEVSQLQKLVSEDLKFQMQHETVKAKMHAFLHFGSLAALLLSSENMTSSPLHIYAMIFLVCLSIGDMVPMRHLIRLQMIKGACVVAILILGLASGSLEVGSLFKYALIAAVFGTIVPLSFACCFECRQRMCFLHVCERPVSHLGPVWSQVAKHCMNMSQSTQNFY